MSKQTTFKQKLAGGAVLVIAVLTLSNVALYFVSPTGAKEITINWSEDTVSLEAERPLVQESIELASMNYSLQQQEVIAAKDTLDLAVQTACFHDKKLAQSKYSDIQAQFPNPNARPQELQDELDRLEGVAKKLCEYKNTAETVGL